MRIIADSGSTKTAWALLDGATIELTEGQGINPFHCDSQQICDILRSDLSPYVGERRVEEVWFYGAGCTVEKSPVVADCLREVLDVDGDVHVGSDMLGAAKALCGDQPGVVCILGTGANSCYFDGHDIIDNVPPLGYILGDEGSGAYIGKRLVGDMFKRQFSTDLYDCFIKETGLTAASVVEKVYRQPMPNIFLASLTTFCSVHREHPQMKAFLVDCFSEFVRRNVVRYSSLRRGDAVNFVGSISFFFREEISEALHRHGYEMGKVLRSPIEGLVRYYLVQSVG
ncbi:MAG: ATPase [Bacteroidaceae bacterium]|nr:ATPase [Bacteroidaceae bacterium]